ncbi:MAG: hypothetical protein R6V85_19270 [Polyangia bacterium]
MRQRLEAAIAIGLAAALAAGLALADDDDDGRKIDEVGTDARLVVFPFEPVNVSAATAAAASEVLAAELRSRGFRVVSWREAAAEARSPAPRAQPPEPQPQVEVPQTPYDQPPRPSGEERVVSHAQPPGATAAPPRPATPARPPEPNPAAAPPTSLKEKLELVEELDCDYLVEGTLVRLGSRMRVAVTLRDGDGLEIKSRGAEARTEDDLATALERISLALARGETVEETRNLDNATRAETEKLPQRYKLERNFGVVLGQGFGVGENLDHYTFVAFDARLEIADVMVFANAGLGLSAGGDYNDNGSLHALVDLGAAYYLSHTPISPYIGAGVGVHFGERVRPDCEIDSFDDEDECRDAPMGYEVFPVFGLELLRQSSIRLHFDLRYALIWNSAGAFGHGPVIAAGINF